MKMKLFVLLTILFFQSGIMNETIYAQQSSSIEQLRKKLEQYVAEGKVFESNKIQDHNIVSEFGKLVGRYASGNRYEGDNYSLIINFKDVNATHQKMIDFILEEKDKLYSVGESYSPCTVYKNFKKDSRGLPAGDYACTELSVVKLKTVVYADFNCMTEIPILKAWKKDTDGKFVEVDVTGLTWYDECP